MTTTRLFSGLGDDERNSSRVLQPPGGGSSNIFGGGEPEKHKVKDYNKSDIFNRAPQSNGASTPSKAAGPTGSAAAPFAAGQAVESPKSTPTKEKAANPIAPPPAQRAQPAQPAKPATTSNRIFGEPEPSREQPSTRVRQPPGGASSGLW